MVTVETFVVMFKKVVLMICLAASAEISFKRAMSDPWLSWARLGMIWLIPKAAQDCYKVIFEQMPEEEEEGPQLGYIYRSSEDNQGRRHPPPRY